MHNRSKHQINYISKLLLHWRGTAVVGALFITLVSCGGSGDSMLAGGGIGGTGVISVGAITGLGSIFVNGIEFETDMAAVTLDGISADQTGLKVGMVVTVTGTANADGMTGTADLVDYNDSVEGPISAIDLFNNDFIILGQTVHVDNNTVYDNMPAGVLDLSGLAIGDLVEVSGLPFNEGTLLATRIEYQEENDVAEITGFVSNPGANQFFINDQEIDFSGAEFENFNGQFIAAEDFVEVKGTYDSQSGVLIADKVINKNVEYEDDEELEISGFIQSVGGFGFNLFTPAGTLRVAYDGTTEFENGTENDLMAGRPVKVEGHISGNVLNAEEISFKDVEDSSNDDEDSSEDDESNENEESYEDEESYENKESNEEEDE